MISTLRDMRRRMLAPYHRADAVRRLIEYHAHERSLEQVVDWAMNFGGSGYYRIKSLQIRDEILGLARRVRDLEPRLILEIGTARAGTLLIWSSLAREEVISCDLRDLSTAEDLYRQLPPPDSDCRVTLLSGDSHDPAFRARVESAVAGRQVDFLFIDGDHSEAGVEADYEDYRHLVRPGGLIAFHDIVAKQPLSSTRVHPFWERVKVGKAYEEIVADPDQTGFGIGVLRVE
ncbi:MAG: class I SAM-dependent methyltransferase [Gammaproteobacteria bacterium]|nr:class I SAM-dependent methyltransferase [Gammaproteobacteria bacterium]